MQKKKLIKRTITASVAVIISILVAFGVLAYNAKIGNEKVNEIYGSKVNAFVEESFDEDTKTSIIVTADAENTSDVYTRVSLVAYWTDDTGAIYYEERWTDDTDVTYYNKLPDLSEYINTDDWEQQEISINQSDGTSTGYSNIYYVYKKALTPGDTTSNLLKKPIQLQCDNGKKLEITVLMQAAEKDTFEGVISQ